MLSIVCIWVAAPRKVRAVAGRVARDKHALTEPRRRATVNSSPDAMIDTVTQWIDEARRVVVLTGAGISTDSGIPDFRGPQGVWTKNPEAEKMSNISYYVADREVRKKAWRYRMENKMWLREPNPGHLACLRLEQREKLLMLVTQNVDGLHLKAGTSPGRLVEIHGTMREVVCLDCGERAPIERALARVEAGEDDPPCRSCGGILKTATISFGQGLVQKDMERAQQAARGVRPDARRRLDALRLSRSPASCRWRRSRARGW